MLNQFSHCKISTVKQDKRQQVDLEKLHKKYVSSYFYIATGDKSLTRRKMSHMYKQSWIGKGTKYLQLPATKDTKNNLIDILAREYLFLYNGPWVGRAYSRL